MTRKVSPNPRTRQNNHRKIVSERGAVSKCYYCDDNGVVTHNQFRTLRSYNWLRRRFPKQRWAEPKAKLMTCPLCKVGGIDA